MKKIHLIIIVLILTNITLIAQEKSKMDKKNTKTDAEWKQILSSEQYHILREKGTDRPGDYGYTNHFEKGTYFCAACDAQLFKSDSKFDSHCGWPSFDDAIKGAVDYKKDISHGMIRTEITCTNCDGHLGHIFDDGPKETTGKRYCVNTTSIRFEKSK
ncbi:MAG: peptide-methionine (R)-S-oxide reductase MsrB [Flavobacteriaceae bacterium]|nr:peptide-methionine (R)-S-oxide reductase MsrB [Flavobacteriaceae bacterium]